MSGFNAETIKQIFHLDQIVSDDLWFTWTTALLRNISRCWLLKTTILGTVAISYHA